MDAAVPRPATKPKQPRRVLVTNLSLRDGKPVRGSSTAAIPPGNYALQQMGKVTGAYEAVFGIQYGLGDLAANDAPDGTRGR